MVRNYLESVPHEFVDYDEGLVRIAKEKFGQYLNSDNIHISPRWECETEGTLPAEPRNRILLFRPLWRLQPFGYVTVVDGDDNTCWTIGNQKPLENEETKGTWLGIVPAGHDVGVKSVQFKWIEKDEAGEVITVIMEP